ncbi:TPA: AbrB/MazE/SpoVT family DNA-binding domain-containing protein [Candidatus Woesearchaeota archaeon]|nr:AbrB/MazE/SpoVT family DNA-binding domain-containing protein [Candidatus Woesearchaeota archaeon]HIH39456.1 AbrB/MazE/SpoVT family DNA-binding domain-containing protein [Candidatus Woesearchaeota archaeon]
MDITKITSKGQVVIPQEIREKEGLKEGEKLLVFDIDGTIILKRVSGLEKAKSRDKFEENLKSMRETARRYKITQKDVENEMAAYRKEKYASGS